MTLLELIVSLVITGMVMAAGYGALSSVVDHRERLHTVLRESVSAAAVRRTLIELLAGARLTVDEDGPSFRGLDGLAEHVEDDEVSFLTTAPNPLAPGEAIVRIYIDRDDMTPEQGLTAAFEQWRGKDTRRIELDRRVQGMEIRYFSRMLGQDGYLPSWVSRTVLPMGIELTLLPGPVDTLPPLLAYPMHVMLEAGR